MAAQLYWEEVEVGCEIPSLVKHPTTQQLVRYAGASGDFTPHHYDDPYARSRGLPGVVVHGVLKQAFLAQLLTDWIGDRGRLRKLSCSYRGLDVPGDTLTCKGKVVGKREEECVHYVECEIWLENGAGEITTPGTATVILPSRRAQ